MRFLCFLFWVGFLSLIYSQQSTDITQEYFVYGKIIQKNQQPIPQVNVSFLGYENETYTDHEGKFFLKIPKNSFKLDLIFKKKEFESQTVPIEFPKDKNLTLEDWILPEAFQTDIELPRFDLNSLSFGQDEFDRSQIGSVLHSQRDAFLNVSAFQFGNTFFRLRGLDSSHNIISINGIQMNSFDSGRPLWSQWGGLNDFTNRGQQFNYGLSISDNDFGGLLGNTEINLRPSLLSSGSKVSQAFSNTTYQIRTMFSHSGSIGGKGIYYALLVSYRGGKTGYAEGTPYDAKSIFIGLEKNWNKNHNTWLTAFYTPNRRGKSAPMTQEVFDLKGRKYNPYWGFQDQKVRNSREAEIKIPVVILNHLWEISKDATFKINLGHQWGKQSSSRLLYNGSRIQDNYLIGGGQNPDPTYYQKLPSYFLRNPKYLDPASAYLSLQTLIEEGQIDWAKLYEINQNQTDQAAIYALYQDVKAPTRTTFSFEYKKAFESGFKLDFEGNYINENNHFFATPNDLLGADHVFNLNYYADDIASVQNNLLQPNKKVMTDDPFLYNYNLKTEGLAFSLQGEFNRKGFQGFTAIKLNQVSYQRDGKFKNGSFPDNSFGKGDKQKYTSLSTKAGVDYAFTGKHRIFINGGFLNRPPTQQNVFSNPRENHQIVPNTKEEESISLDFGYHFQGSKIALKALGYWIEQKDLSEVSYYFADGVGGDNAYFIQEILSDIQKDNKGVEFSIVYQPIPEVKITGVASVGQFTIGNDPDLYLSTVINEETTAQGFENGLKSFGKSKLKGYSLAAGPHQAFSLGFEYEDPNYWRLGIFGNYFSNAFLDPNPLLRTENFLKDFDGLTFTDHDPETAQSLLKQIQFPSYFLLNLTAGKSWRVNSKFFGFFLSFQNLLDETFKTGGFEQGRNANYAALLEDQMRSKPLFGPKYWWGRGTTFFTSFYLRF